MANPDDQSNLPPIPDGGLAEAMPEWLRRPPAWRTLPEREVAAPEAADASALPEPDESTIDPREFLTDDDLPVWLRKLGKGRSAVTQVEPAPVDAAAGDAGTVVVDVEGPGFHQPSPSVLPRFVPTSPPSLPAKPAPLNPSPQPSRSASRPASSPAPAWQGGWVMALLAALLVIAIAVIVVLVA